MTRLVAIGLIGVCLGAGPTTRPTGRPAGATTRPTAAAQPPRVRDALLGGSIRYLVPADWKLVERTDDGLRARYDLPDGRGWVSMQIAPQQTAIPARDEGVRKRLAAVLIKAISEDLKNRNVEIVEPSHNEREEPFMAKIHERFRENGVFCDSVHVYRGVGLFLINVLAMAPTEDPKEAKVVHDAGSFMLLSVTTGPKDPKLVRPVEKD